MSADQLHHPARRGFASDNASGVHPQVLAALAAANDGHVGSYGDDPYTRRLAEVMRRHFGDHAQTYPVFTGTGGNVIALALMAKRWDAAICAATAHAHVDECGAPEKLAGVKMLPVPSHDGKLTRGLLDTQAVGFGFEHHAQPRIVTVTQSTEVGTVYTPQELTALCAHAHALGVAVHLDGARLGNAAAALGCGLRDLTTDVGVDVVTLGGTKNGLMAAEAVVVLNPDAATEPKYVRKMMTQLASKMRFVSAQLIALYDGDLWLRSATHANAMAAQLAAGAAAIDGVTITQEPSANGVFAILPPGVADQLRQRYAFHTWDPARDEVRWMCSFDTTPADVDEFLSYLRALL